MKIVGADPARSIKPGEVQVWLFDLDGPGRELQVWERLLSEDETARSRRYRFDKDRVRFVVRRGILRHLVGKYTRRDPAEIVYTVNPHGKLSLPTLPLKFNLSCCQALAAVAFTLENEIGVDLERVRPLSDLARMAERWFSPEERGRLFALAPKRRAEAFYHVWTQKEAFLKAHGEGLSRPLQDFSVSVDPNLPGRLLSIGNGAEQVSGWQMYTRMPAAGWRGAVCVRAESAREIHWYMPDMADFMSSVTFGKLPPPV